MHSVERPSSARGDTLQPHKSASGRTQRQHSTLTRASFPSGRPAGPRLPVGAQGPPDQGRNSPVLESPFSNCALSHLAPRFFSSFSPSISGGFKPRGASLHCRSSSHPALSIPPIPSRPPSDDPWTSISVSCRETADKPAVRQDTVGGRSLPSDLTRLFFFLSSSSRSICVSRCLSLRRP